MNKFTERYHAALEKQLALICKEQTALIPKSRAAILICKKAIAGLKRYMSDYRFTQESDEIVFFKDIKPRFYSKYIYHISVYNFLMQQPAGGDTIQQDYIRMHLAELKSFFDHNRAFYSYCRSGMTQLDQTYYTRGGFCVHAELEDFEEDEHYSTSHDYKLSKIIANEKFQEYLNLGLARLTCGPEIFVQPFTPAQWTGTQTDAVELIYALKTSGAVNNGNIDIAELVAIFEYAFNLQLNESYHKLIDITRRKKDLTVFLNKLRDALLRFIDDKMA